MKENYKERILRRLEELEAEQINLLKSLSKYQKECSHRNEKGDLLRIKSHFDGIRDVWVCERCGVELKQKK